MFIILALTSRRYMDMTAWRRCTGVLDDDACCAIAVHVTVVAMPFR